MQAGDVFRLVGAADCHWWVVISDPGRHPEQVVCVNLTTQTRFTDPACVLQAGDHEIIKHRTSVEYARPKTAGNEQLSKLLAAGKIQCTKPVSPEVLEAMRLGALDSKRIPMETLAVLQNQGIAIEDSGGGFLD